MAKDFESCDSHEFPQEWDGPVLANVLQILRCDPTQPTGFASRELMFGRPLVYPIEFARAKIDYTGTEMTTPLVQKLVDIQRKHFKICSKKIEKTQRNFKKQYDKKRNTQLFGLKHVDMLQYWS